MGRGSYAMDSSWHLVLVCPLGEKEHPFPWEIEKSPSFHVFYAMPEGQVLTSPNTSRPPQEHVHDSWRLGLPKVLATWCLQPQHQLPNASQLGGR